MVVRRQNSYSKLAKKEVVVSPSLNEDYDGLLSPEERDELLAEIREEIREEEVAKAKEDFKAKARTAIRIEKGLEEEQVTLLMDLPGHSEYIRLDNQRFYHGFTYTRPYSVAEYLNYAMDQAWRHEEETGGASRDIYRKPRLTGLSATRGVTNAPMSQQPVPPISPMSAGRVTPKITTSQNIGNQQI